MPHLLSTPPGHYRHISLAIINTTPKTGTHAPVHQVHPYTSAERRPLSTNTPKQPRDCYTAAGAAQRPSPAPWPVLAPRERVLPEARAALRAGNGHGRNRGADPYDPTHLRGCPPVSAVVLPRCLRCTDAAALVARAVHGPCTAQLRPRESEYTLPSLGPMCSRLVGCRECVHSRRHGSKCKYEWVLPSSLGCRPSCFVSP